MIKIYLVLVGVLVSVSAYAQEELEYAYPDISVWTTQRDEQGKLKNPLVQLAGPLFVKRGFLGIRGTILQNGCSQICGREFLNFRC